MRNPVVNDEEVYYYHATDHSTWGEKVKLFPKIDGPGRSWKEPKFPRICVCPSVALCFTAFDIEHVDYYVYRTRTRQKAVFPWGIRDSRLTGEMWLSKPTTFVLAVKLPVEFLDELGSYWFTFGAGGNEQRAQARYKKRVIKLFEKCNVPGLINRIRWV